MKPTLGLCVLVSVWAARMARGIYVVCENKTTPSNLSWPCDDDSAAAR